MIGRRRLGLVAAASLVSRSAAAWAPPNGRISCKVVRAGSDIGRTTYDFERTGDILSVALSIDLRVRLGFVTLFRYTHANLEHWHGDQLIQFASHTNNNGSAEQAAAQWNGSALAVTGSKTRAYIAPPGALGSTYWNPRTVHSPLINAQDGRLMKIRTVDAGPSEALQAGGAKIPATEYQVTGDLRLNLWYDALSTLAGMQYFAHDGSVLNYEKI